LNAEPLTIGQFHALREHRAQAATPWRAAVLHHQDEQALHAPGGLVEQLRAAGCMAILTEVPLSDPFVDHYDEWQGRAPRGAYDVALLVGRLTPPAIAFAVLADVPLVRLSSIEAPRLTSIETALASGHVDELPVAEISLDGVRRMFTSVVQVTADGPLGFECHLEPPRAHGALRNCDVRPGAASGLALDVHTDGAGPIRCRKVEIAGQPGSFLVELDGRPRRPTMALIEAAPAPLRIVRTDKYPDPVTR